MVKETCDLLIKNGIDEEPSQLYEKTRSVLRRYENKSIFIKDGSGWGVAEQFHGKDFSEILQRAKTPALLIVEPKTSESTDSEVAEKQAFDELPKAEKSSPKRERTITDYCREILVKGNYQWLHVDHFLQMLEKDHGVICKKQNLASVLRKNAKNKRIFKFYGKNCFGLLKDRPAAESVSGLL